MLKRHKAKAPANQRAPCNRLRCFVVIGVRGNGVAARSGSPWCLASSLALSKSVVAAKRVGKAVVAGHGAVVRASADRTAVSKRSVRPTCKHLLRATGPLLARPCPAPAA